MQIAAQSLLKIHKFFLQNIERKRKETISFFSSWSL